MSSARRRWWTRIPPRERPRCADGRRRIRFAQPTQDQLRRIFGQEEAHPLRVLTPLPGQSVPPLGPEPVRVSSITDPRRAAEPAAAHWIGRAFYRAAHWR